MALLIARHGETALNVAGIVQPADTALSAHGVRQACALGARLVREYRVAAILASDLPRARQTAEEVARHLRCPVDLSPDWRERDFGSLKGLAYRSLSRDPLTMVEAPPEGESLAQFEARVARAYSTLAARVVGLAQRGSPQPDLLLVTHGLVLRRLLAAHLEGVAEFARVGSPPNTALVVAEVTDGGARLVLGPCAAHLAGLQAQTSTGVIGV